MKHEQKNIRSAAVRAIVEQAASKTDPMGSYTGRRWKTVKPRCRTQTICKSTPKKAAPSARSERGGLLLLRRRKGRSALQLAAQ